MSSLTSRYFVTQLLNSLPTASLSADDAAAAESSPLRDVPDTVKKQLLSLQVLFPNEFVPALDLLDRKLVTRFRICDSSQLGATAAPTQRGVHMQTEETLQPVNPCIRDSNTIKPDTGESFLEPAGSQDRIMAEEVDRPIIPRSEHGHSTIYYVRSAQQRSSRFSISYDTTTCYEVRLQAWNCSCPAFAFSSFPAVYPEPPVLEYHGSNEANAVIDEVETDGGWIFGGISLSEGMPPVCKHLLACVLVEKCSGLFVAYVEEKEVSVEEAAGWAAGWGD